MRRPTVGEHYEPWMQEAKAASDALGNAVLAGLRWLYETSQPTGAIPDSHGYGITVDHRRLRFIPAGARALPVVVIDLVQEQYDRTRSDWVLLNPLVQADIDQVAELLTFHEHPAIDRWNGAGYTTGSLGLGALAHPTLLAGLQTDSAGCPTHFGRVFCDCGWLAQGRALVVQPQWQTPQNADESTTS